MRAKGFIVLVGVLLAGLVAAWPFRQGPQVPAPAAVSLIDVPLRRPEVALEALPPSSDSPAIDLAAIEEESYAGLAVEQADAVDRNSSPKRSELDALAATPYLPDGFGLLATSSAEGRHPAGPAEGAAQGRNWHPVRLKLPAPKSLRRHRITDGDSLESLAQRYLGQAERAPEIYALNGDILTAPDLLPLGRIIRIPPAE
ncbi:MAG: LysM peptidoglycan-binding domain-containing protein [Pirellulaceae bacterium]|nr:LysM peptidoglycan-binding domain-containing protein [Pirellulaceae bacterium]